MNFLKSTKSRTALTYQVGVYSLLTLLMVGCSSSDDDDSQALLPPQEDQTLIPSPDDQTSIPAPDEEQEEEPVRVVLKGTDLNNIGSSLLSLNPEGPGGAPNQSLRGGDVLQAESTDSVLIGALGVDILLGGDGNDVLIGGTEDFNSNVDGDGLGSDNRDRAFGGSGNDIFIWAPGDGSDFFDGGEGIDVVAFGLLAEERDSNSSSTGAPFFNVSPPGTDGSLNFDGIFLDADTYLPTVSVSTSPGFCTVLDSSTNPSELAALSLDHLVRFSLRGIANDFDAGVRTDDDGLRVALSLRNVEYVVCTTRAIAEGAGVDNVEVLDLTTNPPTLASLADLPEFIQQQIQ